MKRRDQPQSVGRRRARQELVGALAIACFAVVLLITLFPIPPDLAFLTPVLRALQALGVPEAIAGDVLEAILNILMFVPLGLLLVFLMPTLKLWWLAVLASAAVSLGVELVQAVALAGRSATLVDLLANSTGGAIGSAVAVLWLRARERRARNAAPVAREPDNGTR